jgi:hypothetical protein
MIEPSLAARFWGPCKAARATLQTEAPGGQCRLAREEETEKRVLFKRSIPAESGPHLPSPVLLLLRVGNDAD